MPIIAIEGPDKCGKSVLFKQLQTSSLLAAKFVNLPSFGKQRMYIAAELALRDLELWEALYEPGQLYICDRHVIVSDAVYSRYYGRKQLRTSVLDIRVLYLNVPEAVLEARHRECNEDIQDMQDYGAIKKLYADVIQRFSHRILPLHYSFAEAIASITELSI